MLIGQLAMNDNSCQEDFISEMKNCTKLKSRYYFNVKLVISPDKICKGFAKDNICN